FGGDAAVLFVFEVLQIDLVLAGFAVEQFASDLHGPFALVQIEPVLDLVARPRRFGIAEPVTAGVVSGLGNDFYDVAVAQLGAKRHHASVDLGAGAGMSYLGVDGICEIDGTGITRQDHDFAFGTERVYLFGIKIDLQGGEKFVGIGDL